MASTDVVIGTTEDAPDEFRGILEFPFKDGRVYELPVHIVAEYPDDRRDLTVKYSDKRTGIMNLDATRRLIDARIRRCLKGFPEIDGLRNPVHHYCSGCDRWRFGKKIAKQYKIDRCTCEEPTLKKQRLPCKAPFISYVLDAINVHLDHELTRDPDDSDQIRLAADIILAKARELGAAAFRVTDSTEEEEGNSES